MTPGKGQLARVCATCPFLACNKDKEHPAGWYKAANITRLWNGLRTAKAPGMVCHSSDPSSADYGSTKTVHPDTDRRPCAGALILLIKHCNEAGGAPTIKEYQARHAHPLTRAGLRYWLSEYIFGKMRVESYRADEVEAP